jgi:hypothetical protein
MKRSWYVSGTARAGVVTLVAASVGFGGGPGPSSPSPVLTPGSPLPRLRSSEKARFLAGQAQFLEVENAPGGLGPVFNDSSCVACHGAGGTGGAGARTVTRFGRLVDGQYDPMIDFGGPLIQSQGIGLFNGVHFVGEVVPTQATIVAHRRAIPLFGLGLVDAVPDATLLMIAQQESQSNAATAGRRPVRTPWGGSAGKPSTPPSWPSPAMPTPTSWA